MKPKDIATTGLELLGAAALVAADVLLFWRDLVPALILAGLILITASWAVSR
jgi:hypothetical protein